MESDSYSDSFYDCVSEEYPEDNNKDLYYLSTQMEDMYKNPCRTILTSLEKKAIVIAIHANVIGCHNVHCPSECQKRYEFFRQYYLDRKCSMESYSWSLVAREIFERVYLYLIDKLDIDYEDVKDQVPVTYRPVILDDDDDACQTFSQMNVLQDDGDRMNDAAIVWVKEKRSDEIKLEDKSLCLERSRRHYVRLYCDNCINRVEEGSLISRRFVEYNRKYWDSLAYVGLVVSDWEEIKKCRLVNKNWHAWVHNNMIKNYNDNILYIFHKFKEDKEYKEIVTVNFENLMPRRMDVNKDLAIYWSILDMKLNEVDKKYRWKLATMFRKLCRVWNVVHMLAYVDRIPNRVNRIDLPGGMKTIHDKMLSIGSKFIDDKWIRHYRNAAIYLMLKDCNHKVGTLLRYSQINKRMKRRDKFQNRKDNIWGYLEKKISFINDDDIDSDSGEENILENDSYEIDEDVGYGDDVDPEVHATELENKIDEKVNFVTGIKWTRDNYSSMMRAPPINLSERINYGQELELDRFVPEEQEVRIYREIDFSEFQSNDDVMEDVNGMDRLD